MKNKHRYKTDPAFRAKVIATTKAWQKKKIADDPIYYRMFRFRNQRRKKAARTSAGFIPESEYIEHIRLCRELYMSQPEDKAAAVTSLESVWNAVRKRYRTVKPKPQPRRAKKEVPPELRRRNILILQANLERAEQKKQASKEWKEMVAAWQAKWWPVLGRRERRAKIKKRRQARIRATKKSGDTRLDSLLERIAYGPCICYWCSKGLPQGGTADHIIPLAKGGTHTSDNICPACTSCNSAKRDLAPTEFASSVLF